MSDSAENLRALLTVQDGIGGQLLTPASKVADINTVSVPTPNGITREQLSELNRRGQPYGLQDISNVGSDVNLTNFAGGRPTGTEIDEYVRRGMLPQNERRIGPPLPPLATMGVDRRGAARHPIGRCLSALTESRSFPHVEN